ncbi:bifunctional metallophosphatase/5'-nucleotidase [Mycoplasma nasistruthionis]|uniref:Bifunctional metallophosphatase/5'-nucleotidase n=2 Tax=Mycoplasma nasistruthionis TaxID=353852 RepID=A0A5B7XVX6_9MOLU|nr:bifunctional metallophosphatase/5'-nucleotidase [Mycoplasma nasistruthionis]
MKLFNFYRKRLILLKKWQIWTFFNLKFNYIYLKGYLIKFMKLKKLFLLKTVAIASILPAGALLAASCKDTTTRTIVKPVEGGETNPGDKSTPTPTPVKSAQERKVEELAAKIEAATPATAEEYNSAYTAYNAKIAEYAKKIADLKKKIQSEKDQTKLTELKEQREALVTESSAALTPLRDAVNKKYLGLRKTQKDQDVKLIKVFHTNDEHGRLLFDDGKYNNYSGLQSLAQFMSTVERDFYLSAGDMIQGLPLNDSDKGHTIAKVANAAGYDSVAIGNHEFDFGLENILSIIKENKDMPFLSANVKYNAKAVAKGLRHNDGTPVKEGDFVFQPYLEFMLPGGIKAAVIGITTPDTSFTSHPMNSVNVNFIDPVPAANELAGKLKADGYNFVIAITHLGVGRPESKWDSRTFRDQATDVDLVLDGHSHTKVDKEKAQNKNAYLSQTEAYTKYLSELDIMFNTKTGEIVSIEQQFRDINQIEVAGAKTSTNATINKLIDDLKAKFDSINKVVVFNSPINFVHATSVNTAATGQPENLVWKGRAQQTNLGLFGADAIAWTTVKAQESIQAGEKVQLTEDNLIGLYNGGGLRTDLPSGDLTREQLLGVSPFGNRLSVVKVKGSVLLEAIKHGASRVGSGAFAQFSHNVKLNIVSSIGDKNKKVYSAVEDSIKINDKAINPESFYYIATNDYITTGGDQYEMLAYQKHPDKATLFYEGEDLLETLIEYGKLITKSGFTPSETNAFGKLSIEHYGKEESIKNITVNHTPASATESTRTEGGSTTPANGNSETTNGSTSTPATNGGSTSSTGSESSASSAASTSGAQSGEASSSTTSSEATASNGTTTGSAS